MNLFGDNGMSALLPTNLINVAYGTTPQLPTLTDPNRFQRYAGNTKLPGNICVP